MNGRGATSGDALRRLTPVKPLSVKTSAGTTPTFPGLAPRALLLCLAYSGLAAADSTIFEAADAGDLARVQQALPQKSDVNRFGGSLEATALFYAAKSGKTDVVRWLLGQGADADAGRKMGFTPLMTAAASGHLDVVRTLLDGGADVNQDDSTGYTPLMMAAQEKEATIARLLVERGANVNTRDDSGSTALSIAAGKNGSVELVRYFIDKGADFQSPDNYDFTPLYRADQADDAEIEALLRERISGAPAVTRPADERPVEAAPEVLAYDCDVMLATVSLVIDTLEQAGTGNAMPCALLDTIGPSLSRTRLYMSDAARNDRCDVTQEDADGYAAPEFDSALEDGLANCTR